MDKIPKPVIAVLAVLLLCQCCTSGIGVGGLINFSGADASARLDGGVFAPPRMAMSELSGSCSINSSRQISLAANNSCQITIADTEPSFLSRTLGIAPGPRTLDMQITSGSAQISYQPDTRDAIAFSQSLPRGSTTTLQVSSDIRGGRVTIACGGSACALRLNP